MAPPKPREKTSTVSSSSRKAEIDTSRFGKLTVREEEIITFATGLIGFADQRRFVLLDHAEDSPIHWLQSVERGDLAFPVADPDRLVDGYSVAPSPHLEDVLGPLEPGDLLLGVIVTFPHDARDATLNLKAPLLLNKKTRRGVQVVLDDPQVPMRFRVGKKK